MEYLGFWVTRDGVKPMNKKIDSITNMKPPTSQKEVKKSMGVMSYCRYMRPRQLHTLAPLSKLMSIKRKFKWSQVKQNDFEKINWIVAHDTLSTYQYFNEAFKIHTNSSTLQLGVVVSRKGKYIAF